jgi:hypothetical protein
MVLVVEVKSRLFDADVFVSSEIPDKVTHVAAQDILFKRRRPHYHSNLHVGGVSLPTKEDTPTPRIFFFTAWRSDIALPRSRGLEGIKAIGVVITST